MSETAVQIPTPKRARTRERLMDAAVEVFSENGFGASSLELICERAGLTRGAFYYNFESKEQLLLALMERELDDTLDLIAPVVTPSDEELGQVIGLVSSLYSRRGHDHVTWALLSEEFRLHAMRDPAAAAAYTEQFRKIYTRLGEAFRDAAEVHGRRFLTAPETVGAIVVGTFFHAVNEGILAQQPEREIQQLAIERVTIVLDALMPPQSD